MNEQKEKTLGLSPVGSDNRTTIPKRVRDRLKLKAKDELVWIEKGDNKEVIIRKSG